MCRSYSRATVSAILGNCDIGIDFFEKTQGQHFFFFFKNTCTCEKQMQAS